MRRYTMRRTWPDRDSPNDYVFCADGKDAGRCYLMRASFQRDVWRWSVYGSSSGGMEDTLEDAQQRFKEAYQNKTARW